MESPKRALRFRDLRGKTLAFKKTHCDYVLAFWRLPSGPGLAFRSFAFKKRRVLHLRS